MSAFPSLPLFTDAFIADTGHLSAQETGAYLLLLMMAWRSPGCRLPDDDAKLARWARVDRRLWHKIKPIVMEFWSLDDDGFWTQKRLTKEHEQTRNRAERARENGARGGRPKSLENNEPENPAGSSRVSQAKAPNPNPNPIGSSLRSEPRDAQARDPAPNAWPADAFDRFWQSFPNKVGKSAAVRAFDVVRRSGSVSFGQMMAGLDRYSRKTDDRPWCNPATWLNQGRWDDAPAEMPLLRGTGPPPRPTVQDVARERHEEMMRDEARSSLVPALPSPGRW